MTHQQAPIYAAFSSTAAGPTEDAVNVWANKDLPYLKESSVRLIWSRPTTNGKPV